MRGISEYLKDEELQNKKGREKFKKVVQGGQIYFLNIFQGIKGESLSYFQGKSKAICK